MKSKKFLLRLVFFLIVTVSLQNAFPQEIIFPRPFAIAIDDLGWNEGGSQGDEGGPWRDGVRREMILKDYMPIVEVGKAVGVRFMGVFVLSEMDRENVCAKYPTITKQGSKFDNSINVDSEQIRIMNYVKDNAAHLEFGIHGVGHEHFDNGVRTRAEWYDLENNKPWPEQDSRDHLKCFKEIMAQYGFTKENGQSFPESFVPCAYGYYWNPEGNLSTGKLMAEAGVKYANTLFEEISECNPPIKEGGGFDHGVLVISRYNYGNEWYKLSALPTRPLEEYKSDIIETHWPNWLAQDDFLQNDLNKKWINFFREIQKSETHYLAKNTEQFYSQWLYKKYAKVGIDNNKVEIDNTNMPQVVYDRNMLGNLVFKIKLDDGKYISKVELNGKQVSEFFSEAGYTFIYMPTLKKEKYILKYEIGNHPVNRYINNTGTYNVHKVVNEKDKFCFDLEMYGTQEVKVKCERPSNIESDNPNLKVISNTYDENSGTLSIEVYGRDMQGESGTITLSF